MLLDHFHPPLSERRRGHSFLLSWVVNIAASLNDQLPKGLFAVPHVRFQSESPVEEEFVVHVRKENDGVVALIVLISKAEKQDEVSREFFLSRYEGWITRGASMLLIDIIATVDVDLHNLLIRELEAHDNESVTSPMFAATYRQVGRPTEMRFDIRHEPLSVGGPLPTMPLYLKNGPMVPVELAPTYQDALKAVRIEPDHDLERGN